MARVDPWVSPAGLNRGFVKNVFKMAWEPSKADRDLIYPVGINPVMTVEGQGVVLFGDRMMTSKPSAFRDVNVRRLFILLRKAISRTAQFTLFELNNEFTRARFVATVEPFLRDLKGRGAIIDGLVKCDDKNNTPQVINTNSFVADIFIKPPRSINYIRLNFIAVPEGISLTEIAGSNQLF
jgi:phage tail sheath protein FI